MDNPSLEQSRGPISNLERQRPLTWGEQPAKVNRLAHAHKLTYLKLYHIDNGKIDNGKKILYVGYYKYE